MYLIYSTTSCLRQLNYKHTFPRVGLSRSAKTRDLTCLASLWCPFTLTRVDNHLEALRSTAVTQRLGLAHSATQCSACSALSLLSYLLASAQLPRQTEESVLSDRRKYICSINLGQAIRRLICPLNFPPAHACGTASSV